MRGFERGVAGGDVGDYAEFTGGAKFDEAFPDVGLDRHEAGLRSKSESELKLIHSQTGELTNSFQPSFSFTSR